MLKHGGLFCPSPFGGIGLIDLRQALLIICSSCCRGNDPGNLSATGHGTSNYCWLSTDGGVIWSFIGPALFVLTMNILVLIVVIQSIQSSYGMMDKSIRARSVSVARTLCFLTPIFGLSWVFGILSMSSEEKVFQYLFAFLNSLQGLFIFILQCLVRKQVSNFNLKSILM
ncbi:Adhesion G-protein coupled receptor D1 [Bulinus truncatus]|nr:Adhesion G-protein coupled receptor D1 [Bulinus truncatus]